LPQQIETLAAPDLTKTFPTPTNLSPGAQGCVTLLSYSLTRMIWKRGSGLSC
jgi:hypothetical protein